MTGRPGRPSNSLSRIFAAPLLLTAMAITGLVAGLAGDGLYDLVSWLLLAPMLAAMAWAWRNRT